MGICRCVKHGTQGMTFGCRHAFVAVKMGDNDPGLTWWEFRLQDDPKPAFGVWVCRGCIEQYRLPPSVAVLDDPDFPLNENLPIGELTLPMCRACFEEWRAIHGKAIIGPHYKLFPYPTNPEST